MRRWSQALAPARTLMRGTGKRLSAGGRTLAQCSSCARLCPGLVPSTCRAQVARWQPRLCVGHALLPPYQDVLFLWSLQPARGRGPSTLRCFSGAFLRNSNIGLSPMASRILFLHVSASRPPCSRVHALGGTGLATDADPVCLRAFKPVSVAAVAERALRPISSCKCLLEEGGLHQMLH